MPCVVSASCLQDGFGLALGLAARPTLEAAARSAILEMCQLELALAVVEAKCRERGEAALNERDRTHRRRATLINADACLLLQPGPPRENHLDIDGSEPASALRRITERLNPESRVLRSILRARRSKFPLRVW